MNAEDGPMSDLENAVRQGERASAPGKGPPPLASFDLVLHRDGSWTHEGVPFSNRRLREKFDRSVRYLPEEAAFVVQLGRFRGLIDIEEVGFFVHSIDLERGEVQLSDQTCEPLEVASLILSDHDGALICLVKRDLHPAGLQARFSQSAQAEFMNAIEESGETITLAGKSVRLPEL